MRSNQNMENDIEKIAKHLAKKQDQFNIIMGESRSIISESGRIITMLHNNMVKEVKPKIEKLSEQVEKLAKIDKGFEFYSLQAYQEYAEAMIIYKIKKHGSIIGMNELSIPSEAYLFGLMDAVGELKREVLEALRSGNLSKAESYFDMMKTIYDSTRYLRFAEAVIPGFRKKQDTARIQLENSGSEILMFKSAHRSQS
jgi:translin